MRTVTTGTDLNLGRSRPFLHRNEQFFGEEGLRGKEKAF